MRQKYTIGGAAAGLAAASMLTVGAVGAWAAPVTDPVGPGTGGTTDHGVDWTSTREVVTEGIITNGVGMMPGEDVTLAFGEPVDLTFDVVSLQSNQASDIECLSLPVGAVPVQLSSYHTWNASTRQVCAAPGNAADDPDAANDAASQFRVEGVTSFTAAASGSNANRGRWLSDLEVTVEREEAVLVDDSDSTPVDTPVDVDLQANDTIPDGSTGWEVDTTTAEGGTVTDNGDGTVTYTPPAGFTGTDTFTYRVTGPDGVEVEATATITVTEEEEPPVPMVAPGMAVAGLFGAGALAAVRHRNRQAS
ncbi:cadherin-like domain-containing protein [Promicromonospora sp. NPDC019610]|uniref:cadherin-like domain-containing protein n=1 Tax=Promicromonospora sp. NPDC019610 TaxID=3364405 RepID=UPI00379693F5